MARLYQVKVGGIKGLREVVAESYAIIRSPQGHAVRFLYPDRTEIVFFDVKWVAEIKREGETLK